MPPLEGRRESCGLEVLKLTGHQTYRASDLSLDVCSACVISGIPLACFWPRPLWCPLLDPGRPLSESRLGGAH